MNIFKTFLLMAVLTGLFVWVGDSIAGQRGMIIALVLAAGMNFASYWFSDKIVLAMYHAQPVDEASAPKLYRTVWNLTQAGGLPMPRLYMIPDASPNAFATGRDPQHAVVAVTQGILGLLNDSELEGVIAHELSHVKNRDMLVSTIAATMAGALMILARLGMFFGGFGGRDRRGGGLEMLLMLILAPIAGILIRMAISRSREYQADASGAELCGNPLGLASALHKLQMGVQEIPMEAEPATSHMFIVNPLSGRSLMNLFSTHPPIEKRIERLEQMASGTR